MRVLFTVSYSLVHVVCGGLGYIIERRYRGIPHTPVAHEKTIIDERSERQEKDQTYVSTYQMDTVIPKTIFERNTPENLKKCS